MSDDQTDFNDLFGDRQETSTGPVGVTPPQPNPMIVRLVGLLGILALMLAFYSLTGGFSASNNDATETAQNPVEQETEQKARVGNSITDRIANMSGVDVQKLTGVDWASEETNAVNKAAVMSLLDKVDRLESANLRVQEVGVAILSRIEGMKTSEEGAKIAADSGTVAQFVAISEEVKKTSNEDVEATVFLSEIKSLIKKWQANNDQTYQPQTFVLERLEKLISDADENRRALVALDGSIQRLVVATEQNEPGTLLASAIAARETAGQEDLAQRLSEIAKESRSKVIAELESRVRKAETALAESLVKLEDASMLAKAQENNAAANRILEELAKQKKKSELEAAKRMLEQEFQRDLTDIQIYLAPFLANGRKFRGESPGSGPMSHSILVGAGVLEQTPQGLYRMGEAGFSSGRNPGGFPGPSAVDNVRTGYPGSESTARFLERAQELLGKYGKLLVEKGMLAK